MGYCLQCLCDACPFVGLIDGGKEPVSPRGPQGSGLTLDQ